MGGAAIGAVSGFLGQFGASWYAGALIGVIVGGGSDLLWQTIVEGKNFSCVNWSRVGISALIGGVSGAFSGKVLDSNRMRIHRDPPGEHTFPKIVGGKKYPHLQINFWKDGIPKSGEGKAIRIIWF